jgi:hypothetical protein
MTTLMKISCVAALTLAMTTFGATQARAGGWAVAGGVLGGVAVGTAIGVSVANAATPVYYTAPQPVYAAPTYYAPAGAYAPAPVAVTVAPSYYYGPRVAYAAPYPYYHPYVRVGYGWGHRSFYGGRYLRR